MERWLLLARITASFRGFATRMPFLTRLGSLWLAFAVLNLPYWALAQEIFVSRAIFNVDLLIPLLLRRYSRSLAASSLLAIWLADLIVNQSLTYHFASPLEFLDTARYLPLIHANEFNYRYVAGWGLIFIASGWFGFWIVRGISGTIGWGFATLLLLIAVDIGNGSSMFSQRSTRVIPANIAGSAAGTFLFRGVWKKHGTGMHPLSADHFAISRALLNDKPVLGPSGVSPSVVLVVVESLGVYRDPTVRAWILNQLYQPGDESGLKSGTVISQGTTTSAELRELCALSGSYQELDESTGRHCLPSQFARHGWDTYGVHGFSSNMFDRSTWWPLVGLQHGFFAEQLATRFHATCGGAYAGVCDADVLHKAFELAAPGHVFVYALTLNSHLPQRVSKVPESLQVLCTAASISDDVCMLTATLGIALRAVRMELTARAATPMEVTVVGDHPPPFANLLDRNQFESNLVPYFKLTSR